MSPFQSDRFGGNHETLTAVELTGLAIRLVTGTVGAKNNNKKQK